MAVMVRRREDTKILMLTPMGEVHKSLNPYNIIQIMPLEARYGSVIAVEYIDEFDEYNSTGFKGR